MVLPKGFHDLCPLYLVRVSALTADHGELSLPSSGHQLLPTLLYLEPSLPVTPQGQSFVLFSKRGCLMQPVS